MITQHKIQLRIANQMNSSQITLSENFAQNKSLKDLESILNNNVLSSINFPLWMLFKRILLDNIDFKKPTASLSTVRYKSRSCDQFKVTNDPQVSILLGYLHRLKFYDIVKEQLSDPRKAPTTYSLKSILSTALFTVLFRCNSKNKFWTESQNRLNFALYCGTSNERLPVSKTVDDVLEQLSIDEMNNVLMQFFENLRLSKMFKKYAKYLLYRNMYCIALDGEVIHKYEPGCAHDCEKCPYCLKRQRGDAIWYHHTLVVASLVTPQGLKVPLYVYPIHNNAVNQALSDEKLKQECEQKALSIVLEILRHRFPKLNICVLLDALFANGPSIQTVKKNNMEFVIVRKQGNIPTVGADCDGLSLLPEHKKIQKIIKRPNGDTIEQNYQIFNDISYQQHSLNILRFKEMIISDTSEVIGGYEGEWIVSWRLNKHNCSDSVKIGRSRWDEEDLFNTLECRNFNIRHDYSRNSNAQIIWTTLIMLALAITECFSNLSVIVQIKSKRAIMSFMEDCFYELRHLSNVIIFSARCLTSRVQFRYSFNLGPPS